MDLFTAFQVGNSARYFQYSVVCSRRKLQFVHYCAKKFHSRGLYFAKLLHHATIHLCIAMYIGEVFETFLLNFASFNHPLTYNRTWFSLSHCGKVLKRYGNDFKLYVNTVEQRSGNFIQVTMNRSRSTGTRLCGVIVISARTGIHCCHKHKPCGVFRGLFCSRNGDFSLFHRLTQHFENTSLKFGQLIEEKNSVVCKRYFAGLGICSTSCRTEEYCQLPQ